MNAFNVCFDELSWSVSRKDARLYFKKVSTSGELKSGADYRTFGKFGE